GPVFPHDSAFYWTYTSFCKYVDYPGVVLPTQMVADEKEKYAAGYEPRSKTCRRVKQLWEKDGFEGAPVVLQIGAKRYHEDEFFEALAF
ncbi:hypothetical protein BDW02DRAFT_499143, partial [Decorospora gaudefroyi]